MRPQRLVRPGTSTEVSVLAVMALILGSSCFALAAFPLAPDAPQDVVVGLGFVALAAGLSLLLVGPRAAPLQLHATVVLYAALLAIMVAVAVTERGLMLSTLGYIWIAVYVGFFFERRAARLHAGVMIAALAVALLLARAPTDLTVWIVISVMVWVAVSIITGLSARLRSEAHVDNLTGLLNRTGFAVAAARQRGMAQRRGEPISLAVIDLDGFKLVNDRGGHAAGDRLLVELAGVWTATLRSGDVLSRFGGDEFVLLMSGTAEHQVDTLLARLARAHPALWTAGAVLCEDDESLTEAIERADARLYVAKAPQRDRRDSEREALAVGAPQGA